MKFARFLHPSHFNTKPRYLLMLFNFAAFFAALLIIEHIAAETFGRLAILESTDWLITLIAGYWMARHDRWQARFQGLHWGVLLFFAIIIAFFTLIFSTAPSHTPNITPAATIDPIKAHKFRVEDVARFIDNKDAVAVKANVASLKSISFADEQNQKWLRDTIKRAEAYLKTQDAQRQIREAQEAKKPKVDERIFYLDKKYQHLKPLLIEGAQIVLQDPKCPAIETGDVSLNKGTRNNPVFYYMCNANGEVFNVWLSKSEIITARGKEAPVVVPTPVSEAEGLELCKTFIRAHATLPSTIDTHWLDTATHSFPNGRRRVVMGFSAKNGFGMQADYRAECMVMPDGKVEGTITPK